MISTMRWQQAALGIASAWMVSACMIDDPDARPDRDRPPVAVDDTITTPEGTPGSINVLSNDQDPDNQPLSVTAFTQGAHGSVTVRNGLATYTPAAGFTGADSFRYTLDDGNGMTDIGQVLVMVSPVTPGCTIAITGPSAGTYGENIHLTAAAACNTGPAQVQWYHKTNSGYVVVKPYGAAQTLDIAADVVGSNLFYALVRTQGAPASQGMSNTVTVKAVDNTPQCSLVKITAPTNNQIVVMGAPQTLTASATCPAGAVPEYQFWVKPVGAPSWQILPGYTTTSASWVPPAVGTWAVRAVVRTVGSHVNYQMGSMSVTVNVM